MTDTDAVIVRDFSARQIRELLALAAVPAEGERNWLVEVGDRERLEALLTEMCSQSGQSGGALLDSVCAPETPVEVLVAVKDLAKSLAAKAAGNAQLAAATLLYHLSVASALGYHERTISSKAPLERTPLYQELASELSDEELAAIFRNAISRVAFARP
jgi:hypothetical protein